MEPDNRDDARQAWESDLSLGAERQHGNQRHRKRGTRVYRIWQAMLNRCRNKNQLCFARYGGRGIMVCESWHSFEAFYTDMGDPPPGTSIDRINNDGNYEKKNCRWATVAQQHANKRNSRRLTAFGKTQTVSQWAHEFGLTPNMLFHRIDRQRWGVERAITTPVGTFRIGDETKRAAARLVRAGVTPQKAAEAVGISRSTVQRSLHEHK